MPKRKRKQRGRRFGREKLRILASSISTENTREASGDDIAKTRAQSVKMRPSKPSRFLKVVSLSAWFLVSQFKKINKSFAVLIILSIVCAAVFFYLKQALPVKIKSSLTGVKEIELKFSDYQSQGYSPVCGCFREQRPENWRGLAFAARHLIIDRKGNEAKTAYMITVAAPKPITWTSPGERFSADLYFISLPKGENFVAQNILEDKLPPSYRILEKKQYDPKRYFIMFSDQALNINLLGDKPLGAWVPSDGAKVRIAYSRGMFPSSKTSAEITEEYSLQDTGSPLQEIIGIPLGDFLGPKIILWSGDANLAVMVGKDIVSPPASIDQNQVVAALVAHPPFSLRVACIPETSDVVSMYKEILHSKSVQGSDVDYLDAIRQPTQGSGSVTVVIPDIEQGANEFASIYARMKENDVVRIPNIPGDFIMKDHDTGRELGKFKNLKWMEFRYPPIPPNPGFNVFGSFSSINFHEVKGQILVGSRLFNIDAPSKLELHDISSLEVEGGVIQVPIKWDTKSSVADIQFQATANATLNDEPLVNRFDSYKQNLEYVLLISAILSAIAAVVPIIFARRLTISHRDSKATQ